MTSPSLGVSTGTEDLDFEDPPEWVKDWRQRIFWYLSSEVRNVILANKGQFIMFCFHGDGKGGFCTYQAGPDAPVSKYNILFIITLHEILIFNISCSND